MDARTLAAISLSNADYPSLETKLAEAARWVQLAADCGASLAVLPEALNLFRGDGADNPNSMTLAEAALDDWQRDCQVLIHAAREFKIAVTIPYIRRDGNGLKNCFSLVSRDGIVLGEIQKRFPTPAELREGVTPGPQSLIQWNGIQVGGAICFDTLFPEVFESQARAGAELFLVPSLWPGGSNLDYYAVQHSCPIVLAYPAWSRIIDADGLELSAGGYRSETLRFGFGTPLVLATVNFDRVVCFGDGNQKQIADLQAAYGRRVRVRFDQKNVLFTVESWDPDLPICEVVARFGLVPRRQYLADCHQAVTQVASPNSALRSAHLDR